MWWRKYAVRSYVGLERQGQEREQHGDLPPAVAPAPTLYCASVNRRLIPALVFAEGNEVEITGVLITRS